MHNLMLVLVATAVVVLTACSGDSLSGGIRTPAGDRAPPEQEAPEQEGPEQEPPEQEAPDQEPPEQEPAAQEPPGQEPPVAAVDDGGDGVPAGWVIAGAVLVLLLLVLLLWWRGQAKSSAAEHSSWRDNAYDAFANGGAIHDALTVQVTGTSPPTSSSQENVDRRVNELAVQLHALEIAPPNATAASSVQEVLATLATVRSAVQANLSSRAADPSDADRVTESAALVRRRLAELDKSLTAFKAAI